MITAELNALRVYGKLLKMQIEAGRVEQEQTVGKMEVLIRLIRNKKNGGRGEAAGQGTPPTVVGESHFQHAAIIGAQVCRIITENGPHRSQFERDSDG